MKPIESILSGGAWKAALDGGFPTDLGTLGGITTTLPAQLGLDLLDASNGLKVISEITSSAPDSIIGVVLAAIKYTVSALKKAAAQRELNYAEARVGYLAEARGVRLASHLRGYQGCKNGFWRYPRASIAKDHCVPIWDPLGTPTNLPKWMVPYGWTKKPSPWWPDNSPVPTGNSLPDICYDWEDINLDAGDSDCSVDAKDFVVVAWPWAWPLCCPLRASGQFLRYSKKIPGVTSVEEVTAAQYMLPTPQHVLTRSYDVTESKRIILAAMKFWWPYAYEVSPGSWANPSEKPRPSSGYDPKNPAPGAPFHYYAASLARIHGFEVCRSAILKDRALVPASLQALFPQNPDFSVSPPHGEPHHDLEISKIGAVTGSRKVAAWVAAGLGTVVVIGGITYFMATRGTAAGQLVSRVHHTTAIARHQRTGRK